MSTHSSRVGSARTKHRESSTQPSHLASHKVSLCFHLLADWEGFEGKKGEPPSVVFAFQIHTT